MQDDRHNEREDERIDFSALDPSRDELRWTRTVDGLVDKALAERRKRLSIERQLLRWARPALAVAASLGLVAWTADFLAAHRPGTTAQHPAALTVANWAANNQIPQPSELWGALEGDR